MEVKNVICLDNQKECGLYRLEMPANAPLGEAYAVCYEFLAKIAELINKQTQAAMPKDPDAEEQKEEEQ